jgi:hypothetical protein
MDLSVTRLRKEVAALLLLAAAIVGLTVAFVLPAEHSGPHELPIGVAGPGATQIADRLDAAQPGAFDARQYPTAAAVRAAITDRQLLGGITVAADGPTVLIASGAGAPIAQTLKTVAAELAITTGHRAPVHDLAPTTASDPQAAGISGLGLPLVLGGYAPGMLVVMLIADSFARRLVGVTLFSGALGLAVAAFLRFGSGTIDGHYWSIAGAIALGSMAISFVAVGLNEIIGKLGLVLTVIAMLVIGNPLSGLATGWQWLPTGWAQFGQLLPPGAAGDLLRSLAFFDGAVALRPTLVLLGWIAAGVVLYAVALVRGPRARRADAPSDSSTDDGPPAGNLNPEYGNRDERAAVAP